MPGTWPENPPRTHIYWPQSCSGSSQARAIVVEDAISGVEAGFNGHFGLVIGVARNGNAEQLRQHGAQVVVTDLGELVE